MQPGDRAFNDPAVPAQTTAVWRAALSDEGLNMTSQQLQCTGLIVIRAIGVERPWAMARMTDLAGHGWNRIDQRNQLSDIVPIGASEDRRQRDAAAVCNEVMFRSGFAPIRGIRPGLRPPKMARMLELSITAR